MLEDRRSRVRSRISFDAAAKSNARLESSHSEDSDSSAADSVRSSSPDPAPDTAEIPAGTQIDIRQGRYQGKRAKIVSYSGIGWYTVALKDRGEVKVRKAEFRVATD